MRVCKRCGEWYSVGFFRRKGVARATPQAVCKACEQTARDERKRGNRARTKVQRTIRSHVDRWRKGHGLEMTQAEFAERYGWDVDQMAHDLEHAFGNGCPYCLKPFASMEGGLHNVSLDIVDPRQAPYYRTNARWVCQTCNSAKGEMTPEEFGEHRGNWAKWERRQTSLADDPFVGTLLEGWPG